MKPTKEQLQRALQQMLPMLLVVDGDGILLHCQHKDGWMNGCSKEVLETELLYLCSLAEQLVNREAYSDRLKSVIQDDENWFSGAVEARYETCRATWQQRVAALASLKGMKIA